MSARGPADGHDVAQLQFPAPFTTEKCNCAWPGSFARGGRADLRNRRGVGRTWGTTQPIALRDADFGTVRVRAHGVYAFRVADAGIFFREVSGTRPQYGL